MSNVSSMCWSKSIQFGGWGIEGFGGLGVWGIASPKRDVVQLRDDLNTPLSKCGVVVVLTPALALSLV